MTASQPPCFQLPPATQLPKPQGHSNPNALSQANVHAAIELRAHAHRCAEGAHVRVLQRVKMLNNAGYTEENNGELAQMVAFLKALAHQRE